MLVAGIPVAIVAGANAWQKYDQSLEALAEAATLLGEADTVRHAVALDDLESLTRGLARFQNYLDLDPAECVRILGRLRGLFDERYSDLWFLEPDGRQRCNSRGTLRGQDFSGWSYYARVLDRRNYALGDFVTGPSSGRVVLPAAAPVLEGGRLVGIAGAAIRADWFIGNSQRAGEGAARHLTWLLDPSGRSFALGAFEDRMLPAPELLEALRARPGRATLLGAAAGGQAMAYSLGPPDRGMRVLVGVPAGEGRSAARRALATRLAELVAFLLACLLIVLLGTELACARPLRRLAGTVRDWRPGTVFVPPSTSMDPSEVQQLGFALTEASQAIAEREAELRSAMRQRDRLMSEIHHRVKNNLQIVASLLSMQGERIADAALRGEFETARDRVQALATLHRHLDTKDGGTVVPVAPLLRELAAQMLSGLATEVEADPVTLPAEQATSFALLVSEALVNVARHAFPRGVPGRAWVTLRRDGIAAVLTIRDDGRGLPDGPEEGMGLSLIRGFAAHLGGEAAFERGGGTTLRVSFPVPAG